MVSVGLRIERSGFELWPSHCVVFLARHFTFTVPTSKLSGQPDEMLGGYLQ